MNLVIYMLTQHYKQDKVLVIVPTTSLVYQMKTDFESYNCKENIHTIMSGKEKTTDDLRTRRTQTSIVRSSRYHCACCDNWWSMCRTCLSICK